MAETGVRMVFAAAVTRERRARGWTQRELGRRAGIAGSTVAHLEGRHSGPSLEVAVRIARAFGVTVGDLADGEGSRG